MGTSINDVFFARSLAEQGIIPKDTFLIDLGAQEFNSGIDIFKLHDLMAQFLHEDTFNDLSIRDFTKLRFSGQIFELLGFKYLALDVYESENSIVFDLNHDPVPEELKGAGHLVQNFGTTEHVFNQANCFQVIHDLTSPDGGIMWHALPMSDFYYHGFFKYDVKFFERLLIANNYELVYQKYSQSPGDQPIPQVLLDNGMPAMPSMDTGVNIMLRRTSAAPFKFPLDYDDSKVDVDELLKQGAVRA
ncbi:MAG: hypothetical protein H8E30_09145 [Alphaproteobacteria bacterium]|nr:hypothetical protein [Alphaproteobacteria bacterium]